MNIQKYVLKFSSIFLPVTCSMVGVLFFAVDIVYLGHGDSDKWGGKIALFEMAMFFHLFTAISFSVGCFVSIYIYRYWLSTLRLPQFIIIEFLPSIILLIIISSFKGYFWGVFGDGLLFSVISGFLTRCSVGFIICVLILYSGKSFIKSKLIEDGV